MTIRTRSGTVGCMERLASLRSAARQHRYATDALLATALAVSALLELWTNPEMSPRGVLAPCSLAMTVAVAWRRRGPPLAVIVARLGVAAPRSTARGDRRESGRGGAGVAHRRGVGAPGPDHRGGRRLVLGGGARG